MRTFEIVASCLLALLGVRSLVYWARRPLDATSLRDHTLYAMWVTGRVGLWFAVAGIFVISASIEEQGQAFVDQFQRYRWYIFVPLGLAILQLVAGVILGRSRSD